MLAFREGKKVINHSLRKTCISRLLDANVTANFVAPLSGHKARRVYSPTSLPVPKRGCPWTSAELIFLDPEIKLYQVSIIKGRFEVVTRRKFDNKFTHLDQSTDPSLPSTAPVFTGTKHWIHHGCTFQIFHVNVKIVQNERKRRIVIESDEDDWLWSYFLSTVSSCELFFTTSKLELSLDTDWIHIL